MNANYQYFKNQLEINKKNYNSARFTLIGLLIITCINIVLAISGSDTYYLFTAYVPYNFAVTGIIMAGRFIPEFYEQYEAEIGEPYPVLGDIALYVGIALAVVAIAVYVLLWLLSKKKYGFLVAATALFGFDTFLVLLSIADGMFLDMIFHVIITIMLVRGCISGKKYFDAEKQLSYMQSDAELRESAGFDPNVQNAPKAPENPESGYFTTDENTYFTDNIDNSPDGENKS